MRKLPKLIGQYTTSHFPAENNYGIYLVYGNGYRPIQIWADLEDNCFTPYYAAMYYRTDVPPRSAEVPNDVVDPSENCMSIYKRWRAN